MLHEVRLNCEFTVCAALQQQARRDFATNSTNHFYHAVESARITISVFEDCKDVDELYSRAVAELD
jgi:hypothetical protein